MSSRENARRPAASRDQNSRLSALDQLRKLREGGERRVDKFELKVQDPIFDRLEEKDYAQLVAKRRLESQDFVVDDDGLGYADIGEEENWDVGGLPESSEDEEEAGRKKNKAPASDVKKSVPRKKDRELKAAAALMGKQSVSSMFAAAGVNKSSTNAGGIDAGVDSLLDDVLASIGPGEERRKARRVQPAPPTFHATREFHVNETMEVENIPQEIEAEAGKLEPKPSPAQEAPDAPEESTTINKEVILRDSNVESESSQKKPEPGVFNAKFSEEASLEQQARSAWQAVRGEMNVKLEKNEESEASGALVPVDEQGKLQFFILDAYEEAFGSSSGTVYLFGKVARGGKYVSCCVVVRNMQRCVYAVPAASVFPDGVINALEQETSQDTKMALKTKLQELAKDLKMDLAEKLMELNVVKFSMVPVKRSYAFERPDVPFGAHYFLKLSYPFKDASLPADLKGKNFTALFGTHTSALETFLIKRKVKGPSWLTISNATEVKSSSQVSWCKLELTVENPKDIVVTKFAKSTPEVPRLIVASISLKTVINQKQNINEIVSVSVVFCQRVKVDAPMPQSEWNKHDMLEHFSIIRKLDGGVYPMGFSSEVTQLNNKMGSNVLTCESSERALLNRLMIKLHQIDPDVLLGHNISGFDLDVLLHRLQACKVSSSTWSRIGRLKRSQMPRLTGGGNFFGGGAGPGAMACVAGRLLCDTYLSSRELLKEVSYSLSHLTKSQFGRERKEIAPSDIPNMYQTSATLFELVESAETDAWLSLNLMFHLSVLPLTRQLTNVSGNLWSKTLQGARAQRVEYLLLHDFHDRKFILPDKQSNFEKDSGKQKRKATIEDAESLEPAAEANETKRKKNAAYMGGLVLEPKKGLYDKFILLLDFNSLYPSIIQEYNICFTTVKRPLDGSIPPLPGTNVHGVLPQVLKSLVDRRRQVKQWLKQTTDVLKYQQLDIQQQALKLTANSMYGCLGFPNSRFYAKPIAELITSQGREILQSTVDLVQNILGHEVIYGDTDSIMISTGLDDLQKAKAIAGRVIKEVNKKYKLLEIDLDGVFKRMLLLKKKKYACVKVETSADGKLREVIEQRGLDIVRRDWSLLSKEIGNFILEQILSGGSREDVVDAMHEQLRKLQEDMRAGRVELDKYVITKSLTKRPEDYPDSKNQPHVQVALRRKQQGHRCSPGDTIPYVICCQEGVIGVPLAEKARHPDELRSEAGSWMVDIDYYLSQQIHPVVSRLCAPIEGTDPSHIASCLGLDASKFQQRDHSGTVDKEDALLSTSVLDDEDRYKRCEPLELVCPSCFTSYPFHGVLHLVREASDDRLLSCPTCSAPQIIKAPLATVVAERAQEFISRFYDGCMVCDDEMCNVTTRGLTLISVGETEKGTVCSNFPRCNGHLVRQYTQVDLYNQLTHFVRLLDVDRALQKVPDGSSRVALEKKLHSLRPSFELAAETIREIRDRCSFRWIQMSNLCISFKAAEVF